MVLIYNIFSKTFFVLFLLPAGYLLGSVMSAIFVARMFSLPDPRSHGSKNPGATNMARTKNTTAAGMTFLGDALKSYLPVKLVLFMGYSTHAALLLGFSVMLGHMFPIFFQFRGGKGMATAFGVTLAISWPLTLVNSLIWAGVFYISGIAGLASVVSACVLPILYLASPLHYSLAPFVLVFSVLIVWMHGHNLLNIFRSLLDKNPVKKYHN